MRKNNDDSSFMLYTTYGGFVYNFEYKGIKFCYDLHMSYITTLENEEHRHNNPSTQKKKISSKSFVELKDKIQTEENNNHFNIEIGQLYNCGNAIVMITDLVKHKVLFCDTNLTGGKIEHIEFIHISAQNLSTSNKEDGFVKHFVYNDKIHKNGFHSLNSRTLIK